MQIEADLKINQMRMPIVPLQNILRLIRIHISNIAPVQRIKQRKKLIKQPIRNRMLLRKRPSRNTRMHKPGLPHLPQQRRNIRQILASTIKTHLPFAKPAPKPKQRNPRIILRPPHFQNNALASIREIETRRGKKIMLDRFFPAISLPPK